MSIFYVMSQKCTKCQRDALKTFTSQFDKVFGFKDIFGALKIYLNYAENYNLIDFCISVI